MKGGLRAKYYACNEQVKTPRVKWLKEQSTEIFEVDVHAFIQKWNISIERKGDYV